MTIHFALNLLGKTGSLASNGLLELAAATLLISATITYIMMTITPQARMLQKYPQPLKLPFVGSAFFLLGPLSWMMGLMDAAVKRFGHAFVFWVGLRPYLLLTDPERIRKVLSSPLLVDKGSDYEKFRWIFGSGLIHSPAKLWLEDRKFWTPFFSYQNIADFIGVFNQKSKILTEILSKRDNEKPRDIWPEISKMAIDSIVETSLGQPSDTQLQDTSDFLYVTEKVTDVIRDQVLRPWVNLPILGYFTEKKKQEVLEFYDRMLKEIIQKRKEVGSGNEEIMDQKKKPFIDCVTEAKTNYEEIRAHIVTMYGTGFETAARGIIHLLFCLATNAECQKRVHQELDEVFGDDMDREVTHEDLSNLKYLEMCIKESLRIFPAAPCIMRKHSEDIDLGNGEILPKNTEICFMIYHLHRNPKYFPNPEEFIPERFTPEACANRHPCAYIPFSFGPRNCIGMKYGMLELKTCLVHILRKFSVWTPMKSHQEAKCIYGIILEFLKPLELGLIKRHPVKLE